MQEKGKTKNTQSYKTKPQGCWFAVQHFASQNAAETRKPKPEGWDAAALFEYCAHEQGWRTRQGEPPAPNPGREDPCRVQDYVVGSAWHHGTVLLSPHSCKDPAHQMCPCTGEILTWGLLLRKTQRTSTCKAHLETSLKTSVKAHTNWLIHLKMWVTEPAAWKSSSNGNSMRLYRVQQQPGLVALRCPWQRCTNGPKASQRPGSFMPLSWTAQLYAYPQNQHLRLLVIPEFKQGANFLAENSTKKITTFQFSEINE